MLGRLRAVAHPVARVHPAAVRCVPAAAAAARGRRGHGACGGGAAAAAAAAGSGSTLLLAALLAAVLHAVREHVELVGVLRGRLVLGALRLRLGPPFAQLAEESVLRLQLLVPGFEGAVVLYLVVVVLRDPRLRVPQEAGVPVDRRAHGRTLPLPPLRRLLDVLATVLRQAREVVGAAGRREHRPRLRRAARRSRRLRPRRLALLLLLDRSGPRLLLRRLLRRLRLRRRRRRGLLLLLLLLDLARHGLCEASLVEELLRRLLAAVRVVHRHGVDGVDGDVRGGDRRGEGADGERLRRVGAERQRRGARGRRREELDEVLRRREVQRLVGDGLVVAGVAAVAHAERGVHRRVARRQLGCDAALGAGGEGSRAVVAARAARVDLPEARGAGALRQRRVALQRLVRGRQRVRRRHRRRRRGVGRRRRGGGFFPRAQRARDGELPPVLRRRRGGTPVVRRRRLRRDAVAAAAVVELGGGGARGGARGASGAGAGAAGGGGAGTRGTARRRRASVGGGGGHLRAADAAGGRLPRGGARAVGARRARRGRGDRRPRGLLRRVEVRAPSAVRRRPLRLRAALAAGGGGGVAAALVEGVAGVAERVAEGDGAVVGRGRRVAAVRAVAAAGAATHGALARARGAAPRGALAGAVRGAAVVEEVFGVVERAGGGGAAGALVAGRARAGAEVALAVGVLVLDGVDDVEEGAELALVGGAFAEDGALLAAARGRLDDLRVGLPPLQEHAACVEAALQQELRLLPVHLLHALSKRAHLPVEVALRQAVELRRLRVRLRVHQRAGAPLELRASVEADALLDRVPVVLLEAVAGEQQRGARGVFLQPLLQELDGLLAPDLLLLEYAAEAAVDLRQPARPLQQEAESLRGDRVVLQHQVPQLARDAVEHLCDERSAAHADVAERQVERRDARAAGDGAHDARRLLVAEVARRQVHLLEAVVAVDEVAELVDGGAVEGEAGDSQLVNGHLLLRHRLVQRLYVPRADGKRALRARARHHDALAVHAHSLPFDAGGNLAEEGARVLAHGAIFFSLFFGGGGGVAIGVRRPLSAGLQSVSFAAAAAWLVGGRGCPPRQPLFSYSCDRVARRLCYFAVLRVFIQ
eukprot:Rhum_TRINITY_DN14121_c23_g2::Rhum_TRINITY_DN14121_c23_g2_i1::g.71442::m.71442